MFWINDMPTYAKVKNKLGKKILEYPLIAILSHWLFQSIFYADTTERWFKIVLDILITVVGASIFYFIFHWNIFFLFFLAFLVAHTINFLFNGQLFGILKTYGLVELTYDEYCAYVRRFSERIANERSIKKVLICGSLSRDQWTPFSDFDVRIIRHSGILNGARSCLFLMLERSRAVISRFPIDIYVLDTEKSLRKYKFGENLVDLNSFVL